MRGRDLHEGIGRSYGQISCNDPSAVVVEEETTGTTTVLRLHVASEDMGKVIGKQGRIAKAIRTVMKAVATRENVKVIVEII